MTDKGRLRIRREDRERLKGLKDHPVILEGVEGEEVNYEEVLGIVLPQPTEETVLERPEEDMVFVNPTRETHEQTHDLAGENVPAHEVVTEYLDQFIADNDINDL